MAYTPQIGHHVIVADKANAYNGKEAQVINVTEFGIYTVKVGNREFPLARKNIREIKYK